MSAKRPRPWSLVLLAAAASLAIGGCEMVAGLGERSVGTAGGSTPIVCKDAFTNISGDCDLLNQDCPDGQWCDVVTPSSGIPTSTCVADQGGEQEAGGLCTGDGDCRAARCLNGKCSPFCCHLTDQPCGQGVCSNDLTFGDSYVVRTCNYAEACTVLEETCPPGLFCHIAEDGPDAACDAPSTSLMDEGDVCAYRNDCGESQLCNKLAPDRQPENKGICRQLCDLENWMQSEVPTGGCPPERECVTFGAPLHPAHVGICMPPGS